MKNSYSTKQLRESVAYWRGVLRSGGRTSRPRAQIREALEKWESVLNERELSSKEVAKLADYIQKNKVDVQAIVAQDKLDTKSDEYKKLAGMVKELGITNKSVPKAHAALKGIFKGKEAEAKDPAKAAEVLKADPDKAADELAKATSSNAGDKDGNKGGETPVVSPKVEKAVEKELDKVDPSSIGLGDDEEAAKDEAAAKPIGEMNLMDRLRRLHNATKNNVVKKL